MADETEATPEAPAESGYVPAPTRTTTRRKLKRHRWRFVGHQRASNKTQRINGPWGSLRRGGPAGEIPEAARKALEAVGYLFKREEVKD